MHKKTEKLHKKREIQWLASSVREGLGTFILICFWIKRIKEIADPKSLYEGNSGRLKSYRRR